MNKCCQPKQLFGDQLTGELVGSRDALLDLMGGEGGLLPRFTLGAGLLTRM